jgi:hypothetical protein
MKWRKRALLRPSDSQRESRKEALKRSIKIAKTLTLKLGYAWSWRVVESVRVGKVIKLKGAPVPVAADGLGNAANGLLFLRCLVLVGNTDGLGEHGLAVIASTLKGTLVVEASFLVERNGMGAVAAAEDVSTATTVMTTVENREGTSACGGLALDSAIIRLPVVSGGCTSDSTPSLGPLIGDDSRDAGRTPGAEGSGVILIGTQRRRRKTGRSDELEAISGHVHAAVCAARRGQRRLSRTRQLCGAQDCRDVERLLWLANLLSVHVGGAAGRRDIVWGRSGRIAKLRLASVDVGGRLQRLRVLGKSGGHVEYWSCDESI